MVTVVYWQGPNRRVAHTDDYDTAMAIADQTQSATPPRFYDEGDVELFDTGELLVYRDELH